MGSGFSHEHGSSMGGTSDAVDQYFRERGIDPKLPWGTKVKLTQAPDALKNQIHYQNWQNNLKKPSEQQWDWPDDWQWFDMWGPKPGGGDDEEGDGETPLWQQLGYSSKQEWKQLGRPTTPKEDDSFPTLFSQLRGKTDWNPNPNHPGNRLFEDGHLGALAPPPKNPSPAPAMFGRIAPTSRPTTLNPTPSPMSLPPPSVPQSLASPLTSPSPLGPLGPSPMQANSVQQQMAGLPELPSPGLPRLPQPRPTGGKFNDLAKRRMAQGFQRNSFF